MLIAGSLPQCNAEEFIGENSCGVKKEDVRVYCSVLYTGNVVPFVECPTLASYLNRTDVVLNTGNVSYISVLKPEPQIIESPHACYSSLSKITSPEFNFSVTCRFLYNTILVIMKIVNLLGVVVDGVGGNIHV